MIETFTRRFSLDSGTRLESKKETLQQQINKSLERMDLLLKENFELRRSLVYERKKYNDLNIAYTDLKNSFNEMSVGLLPENSILPTPHNKSVGEAFENIDHSPERNARLNNV